MKGNVFSYINLSRRLMQLIAAICQVVTSLYWLNTDFKTRDGYRWAADSIHSGFSVNTLNYFGYYNEGLHLPECPVIPN